MTLLIMCMIHEPHKNLMEVAMASLFRYHIYHRWSSLGWVLRRTDGTETIRDSSDWLPPEYIMPTMSCRWVSFKNPLAKWAGLRWTSAVAIVFADILSTLLLASLTCSLRVLSMSTMVPLCSNSILPTMINMNTTAQNITMNRRANALLLSRMSSS